MLWRHLYGKKINLKYFFNLWTMTPYSLVARLSVHKTSQPEQINIKIQLTSRIKIISVRNYTEFRNRKKQRVWLHILTLTFRADSILSLIERYHQFYQRTRKLSRADWCVLNGQPTSGQSMLQHRKVQRYFHYGRPLGQWNYGSL